MKNKFFTFELSMLLFCLLLPVLGLGENHDSSNLRATSEDNAVSDNSKSTQNNTEFHFKDSSGDDIEYYPVGYLFLQESDMVGKYIGGSFTVIKKINKNGWLVEASENDMPATRTFYLNIPKSWDVQTIVANGDGFGVDSKMVSHIGTPVFRASDCHNLVVFVTNKFLEFTNSLDDTEESIRVLELKSIVVQPCS